MGEYWKYSVFGVADPMVNKTRFTDTQNEALKAQGLFFVVFQNQIEIDW